MDTAELSNLLQVYRNVPKEFQATSYWKSYEKDILAALGSLDISEMQSGKYSILATFGFGDVIYYYHPYLSLWKKVVLKFIQEYVIRNRPVLPYQMSITDIREMATLHCELEAKLCTAKPIRAIEMATFGNPKDIFEVNGRKYSIHFLNYYLRYCFAHKHISFKGNETIVELGSGSGTQVEVLKKLYPDLTILCFDLPAQIFLCETYLSLALGKEKVTSTEATLQWADLSPMQEGRVYCFANWQMPLLKDLEFDVFWSAASFGEMEPEVVKNYLSHIEGRAKWVYLLQARHGKETKGRVHVNESLTFDSYNSFLSGYVLQEQRDAYQAHKRLSPSGGYFEAVWKRH